MAKRQATSVSIDAIPKVQAFIEAKNRIEEFRANNYSIFKHYEQLISDYNDLLEDAEKEVRAKGVTCGPFIAFGDNSKINVDKLYDELGEDLFLKAGGTIETKRVLSIDKLKFEALADSGSIPQEVVSTCWEQGFRYRAPEKVRLP